MKNKLIFGLGLVVKHEYRFRHLYSSDEILNKEIINFSTLSGIGGTKFDVHTNRNNIYIQFLNPFHGMSYLNKHTEHGFIQLYDCI